MTRQRALLTVVFALVLLGVTSVSGASVAMDGSDNATLTAESLDIEAGPGQAVAGETALPAGTELTVSLTLLPEEQPFEHVRTTTVTGAGTVHSVFNLSAVAPNTTVEIVVEHDGEQLAAETTTLDPCQRACDRGEDATEIQFTNADDGVVLEAAPGRLVAGETTLPAGTPLDVVVRSTNSSGLTHTTTTVDDSGAFHAVADLSGLTVTTEESGELWVRESESGTELVERNVTLVPTSQDEPPGESGNDEGAETASPQFLGEVADSQHSDRDASPTFGETVLIPVDLQDVDTAQIDVESGTFDATTTVEDGTGNDHATVVFDTQPAAGGPVLFSAEPRDTVSVDSLSGALTPGYVRLTLAIDGETVDRETVWLAEPDDSESTATDTGELPNESDSPDFPVAILGVFTLAFVCATAGLALLTGAIELEAM